MSLLVLVLEDNGRVRFLEVDEVMVPELLSRARRALPVDDSGLRSPPPRSDGCATETSLTTPNSSLGINDALLWKILFQWDSYPRKLVRFLPVIDEIGGCSLSSSARQYSIHVLAATAWVFKEISKFPVFISVPPFFGYQFKFPNAFFISRGGKRERRLSE